MQAFEQLFFKRIFIFSLVSNEKLWTSRELEKYPEVLNLDETIFFVNKENFRMPLILYIRL